MSEQESKRKKPADFWGIPGSGLITQSIGTAADVVDQGVSAISPLFTKAPEHVPSMFPNLDILPNEAPVMPSGMKSWDLLQREQAMIDAAAAAKNGGLIDKALHWAPALSLGAGAYGLYQGISGLASGEGRTIDNVGNLVSGTADTAAGVTGLAYASAATEGTMGALASASRFAGPLAAAIGFGVYGERESAGIMQSDWWDVISPDINGAFKDGDKNLSMYEAAWAAGGNMVDNAHDYMADSWMGEDVGGFVGTVGGGIGAGATLVGATAANVALGAGAAAVDAGTGIYNAGAWGLGKAVDAGVGIGGAISDVWNSDWW